MAENSRKSALRISLIAVSAAIVAVFTLVIRVPSPIGGYISLCDAAVSFVAYAFGPVSGLIAGGLGTAFADLVGGYPQWAVISFIVHGLEAFLMGLIVRKDSSSMLRRVAAAAVAVVTVSGGYLLLTTASGLTVFTEAVLEVPANNVQSAVGAVIGLLLYGGVRKAYRRIDDLRW